MRSPRQFCLHFENSSLGQLPHKDIPIWDPSKGEVGVRNEHIEIYRA